MISFLRSHSAARYHHRIRIPEWTTVLSGVNNSVSSGGSGSSGSVGRLMLQLRSESSSTSGKNDSPDGSAMSAPFDQPNTVVVGSADGSLMPMAIRGGIQSPVLDIATASTLAIANVPKSDDAPMCDELDIRCIVEAFQAAGGRVHTSLRDGQLYYHLHATEGDEAYNVVVEWATAEDVDPPVRFEFSPPEYVKGTSRCPPIASRFDIIREASCLAFHYSKLKAKDYPVLPAYPPIPGPFSEEVRVVSFHHASTALKVFVDRIQNPPKDYVFLCALPPGSYICNEIVHWKFGHLSLALYKR